MLVSAARLIEHGAPLRVETVELGEPGPDDVLVEMSWGAVNPVDRYGAMGHTAADGPVPRTLGTEGAGTVAGKKVLVHGAGVGTKRDGLWATAAIVPRRASTDVPDGVDLSDAATIGIAGATAWTVVTELARVTAEDRVLVLGASGGVGSMIVSLSKSIGARVWAQTGDESNSDWLTDLGAEHVVVSDDSHLETESGELSPTVVFDPLGNGFTGKAIAVSAQHGRLVALRHLGGCHRRGAAPGRVPQGPHHLRLRRAHSAGRKPGTSQTTSASSGRRRKDAGLDRSDVSSRTCERRSRSTGGPVGQRKGPDRPEDLTHPRSRSRCDPHHRYRARGELAVLVIRTSATVVGDGPPEILIGRVRREHGFGRGVEAVAPDLHPNTRICPQVEQPIGWQLTAEVGRDDQVSPCVSDVGEDSVPCCSRAPAGRHEDEGRVPAKSVPDPSPRCEVDAWVHAGEPPLESQSYSSGALGHGSVA